VTAPAQPATHQYTTPPLSQKGRQTAHGHTARSPSPSAATAARFSAVRFDSVARSLAAAAGIRFSLPLKTTAPASPVTPGKRARCCRSIARQGQGEDATRERRSLRPRDPRTGWLTPPASHSHGDDAGRRAPRASSRWVRGITVEGEHGGTKIPCPISPKIT
jgi:hypothetical protein